MTIALLPKSEFIWYLYPKWNNQLYGYKPKTNVSFFPEEIVGDVVVREEDGIHGVFLKETPDSANKIVLGKLNDTLGDISAFSSFTISFLFKFNFPLPQASKLRVFNAIPNRQKRANSNPIEIYLINTTTELHAAVGQHDSVTDAALALVPNATQWNHATIVYHGSHENVTEIHFNGTRAATDLYEAPIAEEPPNAPPFEYTIGHDRGPANLSLSWFQLFRETLSADQVQEHANNVISQALQAVQVEVKFSPTSIRVEEDVDSVNLLAMRTGNIQLLSVVMFIATNGTAKLNKDFSFQSDGDILFKPGEVYHSINVSILSDDLTEDDENFTVSIQSVDGGVTSVTQGGTVTITIASNTGPEESEDQAGGPEDDTFVARYLVPIIVLPLIVAVVLIVIVCVKVRPTCKRRNPDNYETQQLSTLFPGEDWLELPTSDIQLQEKLGEGAFGEVYKGLVRTNEQWQKCAVKKLKGNATEREKQDLMNELQIMVRVGEHPNIISLIGACTRTDTEPTLVAVRLAEKGPLLHHLKKTRQNPHVNVDGDNLTDIDKVKIARDVASGMLHLATKKCVHRYLAARNVLLGENNVAMVSDFAMSRDGMLPVRWMAPESLEHYTYTTKTDVWSFGVVLWEMQSGGKMPYSDIRGMELVEFVKSGKRLKQPDGCPDEIYEIMLSCWRRDPSQRPSFSELGASLERVLQKKVTQRVAMPFTSVDWLELPTSNIKLQEKLGEGAFGEVYKGLVRRTNGQWQKCAVKRLKGNATEREKRDLMNELQILVTVGEHPNVISLIGACTKGGPMLVVTRLAENGSLLHSLRKSKETPYVNVRGSSFTHIDKLRIARDVANGMLYLASKKFVHRDLAARNVLLGENNVAMVSDFGMSKDVYERGEYEKTSGGMLPVRWMAPESLEYFTFTTKTDVWSFGVVLWEIHSGGKMPYCGLGGMELVEFIKSGERLRQPDRCPDEIYKIMMSCWRSDPSHRPSFSELVTSLEQEFLRKLKEFL